ncbi:MAG: hypothetical protein RMJ34_01690 [candidate division WOR-3 bacterium]|nr:hypothetical protein [candidate division WOR-3 bacterium]
MAIFENKTSITCLVKNLENPIECLNPSCLGRAYLKVREFLTLNQISVSLIQIRDSYCEISIRCPYCDNLIVSFGLNGFNYNSEKRLPELDWTNIIYKVRSVGSSEKEVPKKDNI